MRECMNLEAVDKQQVELCAVLFVQKVILQILQVVLDVSLYLLKTNRCTFVNTTCFELPFHSVFVFSCI